MGTRGFVWLLCIASATAGAQELVLRDPGQKSVRIVRVTSAPAIDGVLDDVAWTSAARVDDLHQVTPLEYAEPSERTEVYLAYDDDALYIGARLYDSEPELITAQNLRQNDNIGDDDRFIVTLDPFNSRRSGYFFGVNANGVRQDGLYQNVSESLSSVGRYLLRRRRAVRCRLGCGNANTVHDHFLRSEHRHVGHQFLARRRAQEREHRLGLAQPSVRSEQLGPRIGFYGPRSGPRPRDRALGECHELSLIRSRNLGNGLRAVARSRLSAHAVAQRLAHDQHGLLRDRGR